MTSEIDRIIPPEIIGDDFHALIELLARTETVKHVLEIGSSAGGGSTSAFVAGLAANPNAPALYCMEISKPRFAALQTTYADKPFVHCFNTSSVAIDEFPSEADVSTFYAATPTTLNKYPLDQVLGWLRQDIAYVEASGAAGNGIESIKRAARIDHFDMVLIDGSEFTGAAELDHVIGANIILLDDTNAYKCYEARQRLLADTRYELIADNQQRRNGYSIFRRRREDGAASVPVDTLPVHFLTIVLNGEPFIRYHIEMLKRLPFRWHWHIVEGVASLVKDTAWSVAAGGRIDSSFHDRGRSNDGTSAYLDELAAAFPNNVTIYRKDLDQFWDGKLEMVSAPLPNMREPGLLWQIDADEIWTQAQVETVRAAFHRQPDLTAAFFWCDYYVGPRAAISTRYNYAQNPAQEWLRVWRYAPGDFWEAHEPPTLVRRARGGRRIDLGRAKPLWHDETEAMGAVFQHFAYVTPEQARFKELYYGYADAEKRWRDLQAAVKAGGPLLLADYFPWVTDQTLVDATDRLGMTPIAIRDDAGAWRFRKPEEMPDAPSKARAARIVLDGVFFQHNQKSGIARVWRQLLEEWTKSGFAKNILLLDRAGTAPRLPGLRMRSAPAWSEHATGADAFLMQRICEEVSADLFVSSYYTSSIETPSIFVAHDFIPELLGTTPDEQIWREKNLALAHAAKVVCISESTKRDLQKFHPESDPSRALVIHNAAAAVFAPATSDEVTAFRGRLGVQKPYFLLIGERLGYRGYKNTLQFFRAFAKWPQRAEYEVLCVGGMPDIETEILALTRGLTVRRVDLDDSELRIAYSGATALVFPSRFEGFGLPVLEAMACACPVITTAGSSLSEVAGEAAVQIELDNDQSMTAALDRVVASGERERLIALGLKQAAQFSWARAAAQYAAMFDETIAALNDGEIAKPSPMWRTVRDEQRHNQAEITRAQRDVGKRTFGLTSLIARSSLRGPAFAVRGALLRTLPPWAMPAARRAWRVLMGVKT